MTVFYWLLLIVLLLDLISISQPVKLSPKISKVFCIAGVPADVGGSSAPRGRGSSLGHVSGKYRGQRERPGEARRHEVHRTKKSHLKNYEPIVLINNSYQASFLLLSNGSKLNSWRQRWPNKFLMPWLVLVGHLGTSPRSLLRPRSSCTWQCRAHN